MPIYKITLAMTRDSQGWTESYYLNVVDTLRPQAVHDTWVTPLLGLRQQMMGTGSFIDYSRVSTVGVPFSAQAFTENLPGSYGVSATTPDVALLVRSLPAVGGPPKNLYLRGNPYTIITAGIFSPPALWTKFFGQYTNQLLTGQGGAVWGWMGTVEATKVKCPLTGYTQNAGFQVLLTFGPTPAQTQLFTGVPINSKVQVRLSGINTKSELNGVQVVTVTGPSTCTTVGQFGVIPWTHGGFGLYEVKSFVTYGNINPEKIVSHKTGRPLFLARGRAPARART